MSSETYRKSSVERWIIEPVSRFMSKSTTSGIILFASAILAIMIANSPFAERFHHFWEIKFSVGFNGAMVSKSLHHWINDGLMAIFFFVVGLELKREIVAGKLSKAKDAIFPVVAALGGMIIPALIYFIFNSSGEAAKGWGIPMATDIAFALGILYLLGDKVPVSLKVILTALAIVDDLGAVIVIAFFYTSEINYVSLGIGALSFLVLVAANRLGVRNTLFYALVGIGGLWLAFLMSGIHATIAAVIAAMTIPMSVQTPKNEYIKKIEDLIGKFRNVHSQGNQVVTESQYFLLEEINLSTRKALSPLQRLEHALHPFVAFIVLPIFALSNAGVELSADSFEHLNSTVFMGTFLGLLIGKFLGVFGTVYLLVRLKVINMPSDMNVRHLIGMGFLAAIGFTMSLFINGLAFEGSLYADQAKLAVILASFVAGLTGFLIVKYAGSVHKT